MACSSIGTFSKMLVQGGVAPRTFGSGSERTEFVYEGIKGEREIQVSGRITGTRSRYVGASREKSYLISGPIAFQPGPQQLGLWLPRILGGAPSGTSYPMAEVLPEFDLIIDREGSIFKYTDMQVAQAIIRGKASEGGDGMDLLDMIVVCVAKTEADGVLWPAGAPTIADDVTNSPYAMFDGALTIDGVTQEFDQFNLIIDNHLDVKFRNSKTPQCIRSTDRSIRLETSNPFTNTSLGTAKTLNTTPLTGSLVFTQGNMSTSFSFAALKNKYVTPTVRSRNEIPLNLQLTAFRTSSSPEITVTHDQTP